MTAAYEQQRMNMIDGLLRPQGILNESLLNTLKRIKREQFVPEAYRDLAFMEREIPLSKDNIMLDPFTEVKILDLFVSERTQPFERVLLIGVGSGYMAALLAQYTRHLYAIDQNPEAVALAERNLRQALIPNVQLATCEHPLAYQEYGPYDAIIVTYLLPATPESLLSRLMVGGRLFFVQGVPTLASQACMMHCHKVGSYTCERVFEKTWSRLWPTHSTDTAVFDF